MGFPGASERCCGQERDRRFAAGAERSAAYLDPLYGIYRVYRGCNSKEPGLSLKEISRGDTKTGIERRIEISRGRLEQLRQ